MLEAHGGALPFPTTTLPSSCAAEQAPGVARRVDDPSAVLPAGSTKWPSPCATAALPEMPAVLEDPSAPGGP